MKNVQNESFMIRSLKASVSPSGICRYGKTFSWLQLSFLFMFLTSCLMAPFTMSFLKMDRFSLKLVMPAALSAVNDRFAEQLNGIQIRNGKLTGGQHFDQIEEGKHLLAVDMEHEWKPNGENGRLRVKGYDNAVIFQPDRLIITDQNGMGFSVRYGRADARLTDPGVYETEALIGQLWLAQYKPMIMMLGCAVIFLIQLFFTAVLAGGIWMAKLSKMIDIASCKEAASAAICASALPAFASAAIGLIRFDLITVLMVHTCGVTLMIAFLFRYMAKTRRHNENVHSGGRHDKSAVV